MSAKELSRESSPGRHAQRRRYLKRTGAIVGGAGASLLLAGGLAVASWDAYHPNNSAARPPAATTPDTSGPSPIPSPSLADRFPKAIAARGFPAAPDSHSSSLMPSPTPSEDTFCHVQKNPIEGEFNKNTGVHTIHAAEDRQSIVIVTPDRSTVQQLRWKLPNQRDWITFNNDNSMGEAGIVLRTAVDLDVDTGENRGMWYKQCEPNVDAAKSEMPSRVENIFGIFGFRCVYVITVDKNGDGYVVQEVKNGQEYSERLPSTYVPFNK